MAKRNWSIFINSIFFVLGFSVIFSLVGVLLQSVLSNVSYQVQTWLGRVGGIIIILFGLYLLGLIQPKFLQKEYKLRVKKKFKSTKIVKEIRERQSYKKKSTKRRLIKDKAVHRQKYLNNLEK